MADPDDLMKSASKFFNKLGSSLKNAGSTIKDTTKQVTGLGRGSVRVELDQTRIAPGGTVHGRVVLAFPEPVEAKRLIVTLRARQKVVTINKSATGKSVGSTHADVYQFDQELRGARKFVSATVAFELRVPPDALDLRPAAGSNPIADAVRTVASALSPSAGPIEWQVISKLEIAWGRDLSSEVDIVVGR
jgi:hypothetical protein